MITLERSDHIHAAGGLRGPPMAFPDTKSSDRPQTSEVIHIGHVAQLNHCSCEWLQHEVTIDKY